MTQNIPRIIMLQKTTTSHKPRSYWVDDHPQGDPSLAHVNLPIKPSKFPAAQVPSKGRLSSSDGDIATGKVKHVAKGSTFFVSDLPVDPLGN